MAILKINLPVERTMGFGGVFPLLSVFTLARERPRICNALRPPHHPLIAPLIAPAHTSCPPFRFLNLHPTDPPIICSFVLPPQMTVKNVLLCFKFISDVAYDALLHTDLTFGFHRFLLPQRERTRKASRT